MKRLLLVLLAVTAAASPQSPPEPAPPEPPVSTEPAAPSRWPMQDLVYDIDTVLEASPTKRCTAPSSISSPSGVEVPWALM